MTKNEKVFFGLLIITILISYSCKQNEPEVLPNTPTDARVINSKDMITVIPSGQVVTTTVAGSSNGLPINTSLNPFEIGKYEVTYELWNEVYTWATDTARGIEKYIFANRGIEGWGNTRELYEPVILINWRDMIVWCNAYSEYMGKTPVYYESESSTIPSTTILRVSESQIVSANNGKAENAYINANSNGFRLPTEAEWEFAARGGNCSAVDWNFTYSGSNIADEVAWTTTTSKNGTQPVGTKASNRIGIYDMSGNVREWCQTRYGSMSTYVQRGGSWDEYSFDCTVIDRAYGYPQNNATYYGFRVCSSLK